VSPRHAVRGRRDAAQSSDPVPALVWGSVLLRVSLAAKGDGSRLGTSRQPFLVLG